jgi:hypothetical protein
MFSAVILACVLGTSNCETVGSGPVSSAGECWIVASALQQIAIYRGWNAYPGENLEITTSCQETKEA